MKKPWHMTQLTFSSNYYWQVCLKFCILEQIIATVLFISISSINNKRSLLRCQSTTAPTDRGWCTCGRTIFLTGGEGRRELESYHLQTFVLYAAPAANNFFVCVSVFLQTLQFLLAYNLFLMSASASANIPFQNFPNPPFPPVSRRMGVRKKIFFQFMGKVLIEEVIKRINFPNSLQLV